ncbi:hypothetical protein PF007_g33102, partial [Phytophthora fragariae]
MEAPPVSASTGSQGSASVATPSVVGPVPPSAGPSSEDARLSSAGPPPRVASSP